MKTKQNLIIVGFCIMFILLISIAFYSSNRGISKQQAEQIARNYIDSKGQQQPSGIEIHKQNGHYSMLYEQINFFGFKKIHLIVIDANTGRIISYE